MMSDYTLRFPTQETSTSGELHSSRTRGDERLQGSQLQVVTSIRPSVSDATPDIGITSSTLAGENIPQSVRPQAENKTNREVFRAQSTLLKLNCRIAAARMHYSFGITEYFSQDVLAKWIVGEPIASR